MYWLNCGRSQLSQLNCTQYTYCTSLPSAVLFFVSFKLLTQRKSAVLRKKSFDSISLSNGWNSKIDRINIDMKKEKKTEYDFMSLWVSKESHLCSCYFLSWATKNKHLIGNERIQRKLVWFRIMTNMKSN